MAYIDGFVMAVPSDRKDAFLEHARHFDALLMEYGALRVVECWEDDVPEGKLTSFPIAVQRADNETVAFAWAEWPDKATRDSAFAAMDTDKRFSEGPQMPFDGKRMIFGGFLPILDIAKE